MITMKSKSLICKTSLQKLKTEHEALRDKVVAKKQEEFQAKVEALEATIAEQAESLPSSLKP